MSMFSVNLRDRVVVKEGEAHLLGREGVVTEYDDGNIVVQLDESVYDPRYSKEFQSYSIQTTSVEVIRYHHDNWNCGIEGRSGI
jgi:hypothetical protein